MDFSTAVSVAELLALYEVVCYVVINRKSNVYDVSTTNMVKPEFSIVKTVWNPDMVDPYDFNVD